MADKKPPGSTLKVGWWVAVTVKSKDRFPLRCYVGEIQAIDERGIRLTLVDWIIGAFVGWDLFIPHDDIGGALVCTDQHDRQGFPEAAGRWQGQVIDLDKTQPLANGAAVEN